jgi:cation diffusion facilitator CzcD-associated flavoprotein CzcO
MFPHHSHIIAYFDSYVDNFQIRDHITFNTSVTDVSLNGDGTYRVATDTGLVSDYQYVIVANGHHWNPRFPEPAFKGEFTGEVLHSHFYTEAEQLANKNVLVVGIGNSAVDIACETAKQHTGHVTISSRSGAYIVPNWFLSTPFDNLASPLTAKLPLALQRIFLNISLFIARGRQQDYGVPKPNRPILSEHPTLSQELLNVAGRGLVDFKPNVKELKGREVVFEDGSSQTYDTIVYATGYKVTFPFLKDKIFDVTETNDLRLYKKVIHPDWPNLFFLALIQPLGAIMPLAEVQAKWIAKIIKGECNLPTREAMRRDIETETAKMTKRYNNSPRHTLQVDFHPYKASIEREMAR